MVKQQLNPLYLSNLIQTADVVDTSDLSPKYFNIVSLPKLLTSGKNLLKLAPKSGTLVTGAPVLVELIDAAGNTIYHEVLNYVGSDKSRSISIHIYPDSAPGTARIYLASVAREGLNGEILSPQSNELNVVWYADLEVSPVTKNSTEIIFTQRPTVTIRERTVPYVVPASGSSIDATVTGSGTATFQLQSYIRSENVLSGNRRSSEFIEAQLDTTYKRNIQTRPTVAGALATSGEYITVSGLGSNSIKSSGFTFTKDMVGGKVIVRNAKVTKYLPGDIANPALHDPSTIIYSASIIDVVNSSTINVDNPFKYTFSYVATDGSTKTTTINSFEASTDITASYIRLRTNATASSYTASFVDCEFTDLAPGGGSIYKIRTYYKPTGLFGDFIDNGETVLVPYNILRDKNNITASIASGIQEVELSNIYTGSIDTYFSSSYYNVDGTFTVRVRSVDDNIIDGIRIGGTGGLGFAYYNNSYVEFAPKIEYTPTIYRDTQYSLRFGAYAEASTDMVSSRYPTPRVDVFLSGSKNILLGPSKYRTGILDTENLTSQYGVYVGSLEGTDAKFDDAIFDFKALGNGQIRPVFVIRSGRWTFNRIQIIVPVENGFSPNYARLLTKIDPVYDNTEQIFKFQYFDYQSNQAALETIVYGPNFSGGNTKLLGKTTGTGITIRDDVGNPAELTGGGVVDITPGLIEIRNDTEGPLKLGPGTIELSGSLADTYTKIEPGVIRITSGSGTTSIYREPNGVSDNIYLPSGSGIWGTFLQNDGTGHLHWSLIAVSASYALTASYVNPLHQTVIISGAIDFKPTQDPDPNGLDVQNTFLFVSSSNTSLGQDLYIRQNGNLVKWKWFEGGLSTSLLYGGALSYSGSTNQFTILSGSGIIVDYNATTGSEISPQVTYVAWPTQTLPVTNIATTQNTYVYVGSDGSINQQSTFFTPNDYQQYIPIGRISHYNSSTINGTSTNLVTGYDLDSQQNILIRALGPLKISGFDISGQTSTLRLNVSSGEAFNLGGYYQYNQDIPSTYIQNSSFPTASIIRIYRSGSGYKFDDNAGAYYTQIDPANYDNNTGILQAVGNNNWSIQRVTVNPVTGRAHVYYGQTVYSTLNDAITNLPSDPFTEDASTKNTYVLSAFLVVRGNTTNLLDTVNNKILRAPLFRAATGVGGGGTGGTSTTLSALTDVAVASILDGDLLIYDNASGKWVNRKTLTGNYQITGSLGITGGVTGSLLGTSSFAVTSSYAIMSGESLITSENTGTGPYLPVFVAGAGSRPLYVDSGLRYDATQNALTASYFKGDLVGTADLAVTASYANLAKESEIGSQETSANQYYVVLSAGSGSRPLGIDTGLQYNPGQNALTASYFVGALVGTASFAATASYALNATSTPTFPYTGSAIISGSLIVTGSVSFTDSNNKILLNDRVLYDNNGSGSVSWNTRQLVYSDGTTAILDWQNGRINDTSAVPSIYTSNRTLNDPSTNISVEWGLRYLRDSAAGYAMDWDNRILYDASNNPVIDWNLYSIGGFGLGIDWGLGLLYSASIVSADWKNRQLRNITGTTVLDWSNLNRVQVTGSLLVSGGVTGSLQGTASFATTASYALNGGVTQIVAGTNISISPTGGTGAVTINSTGTGGSSFPYTGSAIVSGSLIVTGSVSSTGGYTGSLFGTASYASNFPGPRLIGAFPGTGSNVTGGTAATSSVSILVPANTLRTNSTIEIVWSALRVAGSNGSISYRAHINTTDSLTGATQLGIQSLTAGQGSIKLARDMQKMGTVGLIGSTTLALTTDYTALNGVNPNTTVTVDNSSNLYFLFSAQNASALDTSCVYKVRITEYA